MNRAIGWALAALALAGCQGTARQPRPATVAAIPGPVAGDASQIARMRTAAAQVLFWSQNQRDANFRRMERIFPTHVVRAGGRVRPLPAGAPLPLPAAEIDAYMTANHVAGIIVVQDGRVRLERYAMGFTREGRWTSFSVAKSFTSTLVGAAIRDGFIRSVNDLVTCYIPELAGSGYDGVTVAQLLTMTSGVRWNESYIDPNSDVARMFVVPVPDGQDPTVAYMRTLPRESAPGAQWVYKTGETNLVGVLVRRATGMPLATYLSRRVWIPAGMEHDAYWMIDQSTQEVGGCCLSVSLPDYARMGLYALEGGRRGGAVPATWFAEATRAHAPVGAPGSGFGYGYQWWTYPEGRYGAQGIFGQSITIDPARRLVIAIVSSWPQATGRELSAARTRFIASVVAAAAR